jgi:hypothetical protein
MHTVGLMRGIKGSSPLRMMASIMLQLDIRSANTVISGTTDGPHTVLTRARASAGVDADDAAGVAAGAGATRAAPRAAAACDAPTRKDRSRYTTGRDGHQVGSSTLSRSKICLKSDATSRTGDDSIQWNQLVRRRPKYRTNLAS